MNLFVAIRPVIAVADAVKLLKGVTARRRFHRFFERKKQLWGDELSVALVVRRDGGQWERREYLPVAREFLPCYPTKAMSYDGHGVDPTGRYGGRSKIAYPTLFGLRRRLQPGQSGHAQALRLEEGSPARAARVHPAALGNAFGRPDVLHAVSYGVRHLQGKKHGDASGTRRPFRLSAPPMSVCASTSAHTP
ncbi:hypothetical protein [Candidatus Methylacidithermus pantelleriae]|uniref:hypothetical protein n=1 Tax=Candidatus Methylacidithermus pantelleriae TaxID=2744239 RepID=UPI001BD659AD|nr:hypothetical protein [Candidatus Methylacidithermus pantelleriae]